MRIVGEVHAGAGELPTVLAGTAARIMTGAPMPPGADSVVPVELAEEHGQTVTVPPRVERGTHVRAAAHDTRAGDEICLPGALTPAKIAVLASLGVARAVVRRRPVVAVLSTGDELVGAGAPLGPGQLYDANAPALAAAAHEAGAVALVLHRVRDDEAATERALAEAVGAADLVVTSGGVSVGRRDYVRSVLERRGTLEFWRIAVQPGKPLAVGRIDGTPIVGLPGNPVSALVTFELFARPAIRAMAGLEGDGRLHVGVRPTEAMRTDPERRAFLRVIAFRDGGIVHARPAGGQSSSQLRPMGDANALLAVPEGTETAESADTYDAILLEPIDR
jgi:molybdopterin molybdotransferase